MDTVSGLQFIMMVSKPAFLRGPESAAVGGQGSERGQGVRVSGCQGVRVSGCQGVGVSGCQSVRVSGSRSAVEGSKREGRPRSARTHACSWRAHHEQRIHRPTATAGARCARTPEGEGGVAAAVVELNALANAVRPTTQDEHLHTQTRRMGTR